MEFSIYSIRPSTIDITLFVEKDRKLKFPPTDTENILKVKESQEETQ
jgi:hypothetical protein